ncbi:MAG: SLBB domain-containing protein [Fimbriimonadaceae bacterium]|nr:SLBB domain-containing protein [Chthonomonadaceae bacterium]MCO5295690.1 SLBB domain-containing protein [Fimbriimonadaceae bacterium]
MRAFLSLVVLLGCLMQLQAQAVPTPPEPKLHPGDVISVTVFGYHPYGGDFTVFDDGTINGEGFGRLVVQNLTLGETKARLEKALASSLKDPSVRVVLKSQRRPLVYVLGLGAQQEGDTASSVRRGGALEILPGMTLRQLVATITLPSEPDLLDATLHRKDGSMISVDLLKLAQGSPDQWNGLLEGDDTLVILPKPYIRIWLLGAVKSPGEVRVREGLDVYKALSAFGGPAGTGDLPEEMTLTIKRGPDTHVLPLKPAPGNPSFKLEAGDVLYVEPTTKIRITVGGDVMEPGTYLVNEGSGIGRVVAEARGTTPTGTLAGTLVMRGADVFRVDATGPVVGGPDAAFELQSGDFVYVPRNERWVYALGEVNSPGQFIIPDGQTWTAADLLGKAHGLGGQGTLRRVTLLRAGPDGKVVPTKFNLDEFLKDGRVESNPQLQVGDVLFFGEPKGITIGTLSQLGQAAFYFDAIFKIRK